MAKQGENVRCSPYAATCCSMTGMLIGIVALVLGAWLTVLDARFSPVYTAITCRFQTAGLQSVKPTADGSVEMYLQTDMQCENPNPYSLNIDPGQPSKVYLGPVSALFISVPMTEVGEVVDLPKASLPAEGTGAIHSVSKITLSPQLLTSLAPALLADVPIKLSLDFDVLVDVSFVFGSWHTSLAFDKDCGMLLAGLPTVIANSEGARVGPMTCADSFEELELLPVSAAVSNQTMVFSGISMAPEEIEEGERLKDEALTWAKIVCYGLGFIFLCVCAPCCYFARGRLLQRGPEWTPKQTPEQPPAAKDEETGEAARSSAAPESSAAAVERAEPTSDPATGQMSAPEQHASDAADSKGAAPAVTAADTASAPEAVAAESQQPHQEREQKSTTMAV